MYAIHDEPIALATARVSWLLEDAKGNLALSQRFVFEIGLKEKRWHLEVGLLTSAT